MLKTMIAIKKRAGLSDADFVAYYEERHIPLVASLLPVDGVVLSRRNYIRMDDPITLDGYRESSPTLDFDVITETGFKDREAAETFIRNFFSSEAFAQIQADEDNFVARGGVAWFAVEEREWTPPG